MTLTSPTSSLSLVYYGMMPIINFWNCSHQKQNYLCCQNKEHEKNESSVLLHCQIAPQLLINVITVLVSLESTQFMLKLCIPLGLQRQPHFVVFCFKTQLYFVDIEFYFINLRYVASLLQATSCSIIFPTYTNVKTLYHIFGNYCNIAHFLHYYIIMVSVISDLQH